MNPVFYIYTKYFIVPKNPFLKRNTPCRHKQAGRE